MRDLLEVVIPGRPPSPNNGARQQHWAQAAAITSEWRNSARLFALQVVNREHWRKADHCTVDVHFFLGSRARRDLDNLIASTKALTDGLVDAGVMEDDSIQVVRSMTFGWSLTPGYEATRYTIRAIREPDLGLEP